jgi:hypothetical protein
MAAEGHERRFWPVGVMSGIALSCFAAFWNALEVIEVVEQDQENV